jgi:hypothetical protein
VAFEGQRNNPDKLCNDRLELSKHDRVSITAPIELSNFNKLAMVSSFLIGSESSHPLIGVASALDGYFANQTLSSEICLDELIRDVVEFGSPGEVIFGDEVEVAMHDVVLGRVG